MPIDDTPVPNETPPTPEPAPAPEPAPTEPVVPSEVPGADPSSIIAGFANLGITPDNAHQYVQTAEEHRALLQLLDDPQSFLDGMRTTRPEQYQKLLNLASDQWIERNPVPSETGGVPGEVISELTSLRRELEGIKQGNAAAAQQQRISQTAQTYSQNLNAIVAKIPDLKPFDKQAITHLVGVELAQDRGALARINQGVMVDIPRAVKSVYDRFKADRQGAAANETKAREAVVAGGQTAATPAAEGIARQTADEMWETTSAEFARSLQTP